MRVRLLLMLMALFLTMVACTITGRATPTPRSFNLTVSPAALPTSGDKGVLPTSPSGKIEVPTQAAGIATAVSTLIPGKVEVPTQASDIATAISTLLPGLPPLPGLGARNTATPTATPTVTR